MRYVYGCSACNVTASASSSPDSGMFRQRTEDIQPGLVEFERPIFDQTYWDRPLNYGPLHKRGWVFREVILPPRVLYFSSKQILWECSTKDKCEGPPRGIPFPPRLKNLNPPGPLRKPDKASLHQPVSFESMNLWMDLVWRYSQCEFTKPEDKLWAFAGIAKLFQEALGGEYLAGFWKSRLLECMTWWVNTPNLDYRPLIGRLPGQGRQP